VIVIPADMLYIRGWDDCLEALSAFDDEKEIKKHIQRLRKLIRQNKFEKIQTELGLSDLFKSA
jgi:DNA-binding response OmpR family regulator